MKQESPFFRCGERQDVVVYPKNKTGMPTLEKTLREAQADTGKHNGSTDNISDGYAHTGTGSDGVGEDVLQKGVGHMPGTSLPIGGASTHAVLSAHAGLPSARLFTDLDQLVVGDQFCIHVLGETLYYEVDQTIVTLPSDTDAVQIVEGADYVTLLTCTPYGVNTHRLLVRGHRIDPPAAGQASADEPEPPERASTWTEKYLQGIIAGVIGTAGIIGIPLIVMKIRKKRK